MPSKSNLGRRIGSLRAWPDLPALAWGSVLGIGVGSPWIGGGRLFLLDWVTGPHAALVPPNLYGLTGGLTSGVPLGLMLGLLDRAVGSAATWLPVFAIFPVAAVAISRLVGGGKLARLGAATLFCVNPFVFERVGAGHIGLLLGYALLPFGAISAIRSASATGWRRASPALWWVTLTVTSPHYVWIYGVVLLAVLVGVRPLSGSMRSAAATVASFAVLSLYILLPSLTTSSPVNLGTSDLAIFRTRGDPHLGLFGNVLGLYGFWREARVTEYHWLPKYVISGWPIFLAAILLVAGYGALSSLRWGDHTRRKFAWVIAIAGVAGYFLALGDQGPTGPLFRLAYEHLPFFSIMREPQKFVVLVALAYSFFFGRGLEALFAREASNTPVSGRRRTARALGLGTVALLLPLAYTPTLFDGLGGAVSTSTLPSSWTKANSLMGHGAGQVLFLPWHLYISFPFTGERRIANPAPTSFARHVISGDNIEAGKVYTESTSPRSAYVESLLSAGPSVHDLGARLIPIGVRYIVLSKVVDWHSYHWLSSQNDLRPVFDSPSLEVWSNTAYVGRGLLLPHGPTTLTGASSRLAQSISPVAWSIPAGRSGWVSLPIPYQSGWSLGGRPARKSPWGTVEVLVGRHGGTLTFGPWLWALAGYLISGLALLIPAVLVILGDQTRRSSEPVHSLE